MANTLRFKRGLVSGIPTAALGEPLFTTDTFDLYIGNGTGNTRFQKYIASGTTSQLLRGDGSLLTMPIVLTSPSNGQVLKYDGTNWVNDSDAGITGSGTTNYLPKFTGASALGNSNLINDASGNLGLGVTPSAWTTGVKAYEINSKGNALISGASTQSIITANAYFDGSWKYGTNGVASYYQQINAVHSWHNAISGTANGLITFTQAMTLNASGRLLLGSTSDSGQRLQVTGDGYFSGAVGIGQTTLTGYNLRISSNITGLTSPIAVFVDGAIQATATGANQIFRSSPSVVASATISEIRHFSALQGTFGAGATIGTQTGFFVHSSMTGATTNYGFYGDIASGTGRWNLYMNGTAQNFVQGSLGIGVAVPATKLDVLDTVTTQLRVRMSGQADMRIVSDTGYGALSLESNMPLVFRTNATERMRLDASGNLGLGVTPSAWTAGGKNFEIGAIGNIIQAQLGQIAVIQNATFNAGWKYSNNGFASFNLQTNGQHQWFIAPSGTAGNAITFTQAMTLFATGNLAVGTTTDAGYRLDVNGTMRVSGASTLSGFVTITNSVSAALNQNATTYIAVTNTDVGVNTKAEFQAFSRNGGTTRFGRNSNLTTAYKILNASDGYVLNETLGDFAILNDNASGSIKMAAGGSSTAHFTIASTGAATFGGTVTISGGNGYQVINSAATTVTALRPTGGGASIMSTNSNGLHIAVGTQAAGDLILASNNTERIRLSSNGFFSQLNATNPSASITDSYIQYSADVTAGNAAPHFRTENGAVIKLYQETTAVGNAIFSQGGGNAVLDDSTFAGYTLRQIVQALRNQGILQ